MDLEFFGGGSNIQVTGSMVSLLLVLVRALTM